MPLMIPFLLLMDKQLAILLAIPFYQQNDLLMFWTFYIALMAAIENFAVHAHMGHLHCRLYSTLYFKVLVGTRVHIIEGIDNKGRSVI